MAAVIGVDWTTGTTGDLNGTTVNLSNIFGTSIFTTDLSGSDYSAAPLSTTQEIIGYNVNSSWTANFSSPVNDLLLYPAFWRGGSSGVTTPNLVTYTFSQPFTVLSGLAGTTVVGNTLSVAVNGFYSGIIRFSGAVSSVSVTTNATSTFPQGLTFGVDNTTPPTTPEPSSVLALLALGIGTLATKKKTDN